MAQVHNRVNAGVMDGVVYGGMMEESQERFETWYRGYKAKYGSDHDHLLWLTDDIDYARSYGNRIEKIVLDRNKLNAICVTDLDDGIDYLGGPSEMACKKLTSEGYNCYYFEANDDYSRCMCLWDKSAIISRRELSREEFNRIKGYEWQNNPEYDTELDEAAEPEDEEYEIGPENGGLGAYEHVVEGRKTIYISESQLSGLKKILCESASEREKKFLKIYAVNTYGTTDNFDSAGFILTTGELLNFGNYNEIYRKSHGALDLKGKNFRDFINAGNIRVNPQSPGIEFCDEPTDEQYQEIHKMIKHYLDRGVFYVDCIDSDGKNIWNKEYHGEETNKVVDDIKLYFKNGVNPEDKGNDVLMGYSLSDFLEESKATKHNIDVDYNKYIKSLIDFMREQHLRIDPLPEIELNPEEQDGIFVKTGYYSPDERKVVVFTDGRHPKDVLRTVAHEFIHHMQNLQNPDKDWGTGGDLEEDSRLRSIEGEAFLLGNIIFREWTEKMRKTKELNESINVKKALKDLKKRRDPDNIENWGRLNESHYDEYYHFTEMDNLISLLRDGKFYFAGSDKNSRTSQYAKLENGFRGGKNGYLSLTRMRNIEQGYQYEQSKNKGAFARITFDGNVLNNLKNVQIKPLDFIYNWNQKTPYFQDYTPTALSPGSNGGSKRTWFFAQGKSGKELYNDSDFNKDWSEYYGNDKNGERFRENIRRQFQNQAEESLVLNNEKGMMDANEMKAAIKRIDILILNPGKGFTPEYIIKNYGLDSCWAKDRIFIYPLQSKTYFNLGKNKGCINVAEYLESKEHDDYWDNYISMQGALKETKGRLDEIEAEIVEPDDVDLSSFNIKKHLNPKFWDDGHLDTRIRLKLLDIADDFFDSLDVDWVEPVDVIITGSIANYNWNKKYSDIDLHVLVDYEDVDERVDFVREYFTLKKNAWNEKHKNLRIFGFPVEVYVQDANEPHASSGVYSIVKDKWLTEPDLDNLRSGKVDKKHVREMVSTYMNKIDCLVDIYKKHKDDEYEMKKVARDASKMFDEIKKMRKDDLAKYGREMCDGNIIFKSLRRSDYIGKLIKLKDLTYDKINSI